MSEEHKHDHDHGDSCCHPKQPPHCEDEGCTGCHDHGHEDPDQHRLEMEFIVFVRQNYPQDEMKNDNRETQQKKLADLLQRFDQMKEQQEEAAIVLRKQVAIIQERFPKECDCQYQPFFSAQYWIDNLIPETKQQFDAANDGMVDPLTPTVLPPTEEVCSHVYKVQMYSPAFLTKISAFLKYVEKWLLDNDFDLIPPNTMNRYGLTLEYLGLGQVFVDLCQYFLKSIVPSHFPFIIALQDGDDDHESDCCGSRGEERDQSNADEQELENHAAKRKALLDQILFDDVHTFTVQYRVGVDLGKEKLAIETPSNRENVSSLALHTDASHITLNICLGDEFTDGDLYCHGLRCPEHQQVELSTDNCDLNPTQLAETGEDINLPQLKGYAYIHTGTLRHGAHPITSGFRQNLIIWAVNSKLRSHSGYFGPCFICATQVVGGIEFVDETGEIDENGNRVATSSSSPLTATATSSTTPSEAQSNE